MSQNSKFFNFVQGSMFQQDSLERYLRVCARNKYSLGNCAKALTQNPNIISFASKDDIEKEGGAILQGAIPIEVNAPFRTPHGTKFTSVKVFDLAQTTLGIPKKNFNESDHLAIIALMARSAGLEVEEHVFKDSYPKHIYYEKASRKYWLREGVEPKVQAMLLAKELILKKIGTENKKALSQGKNPLDANTANCVAMTAAFVVESWLGGEIKKIPAIAKQGICSGDGFYKNVDMAVSLARRYIKSLSKLIDENRRDTQPKRQMR